MGMSRNTCSTAPQRMKIKSESSLIVGLCALRRRHDLLLGFFRHARIPVKSLT